MTESQAPNTPLEALTLGLYLALSAPTEAQAQEAVALSEGIASGMTAPEVEKAKANALAQLRAEEVAQ